MSTDPEGEVMVHYSLVVIRFLLIASLIASSLPAMPAAAAPIPLHPMSCFEQQALAAPAMSVMHDRTRRAVAACINTIRLFRRLNRNINITPEIKKQAKSLMLKAAAQKRKGRLDLARCFYDAVLVLNPSHALAHLRRGMIHYAQKDLAHAKKDIARALELKLRAADGRVAGVLLQEIEETLGQWQLQTPVNRHFALKALPMALAFFLALGATGFSMGGARPWRGSLEAARQARLAPLVSQLAGSQLPRAENLEAAPTPPIQTLTHTFLVTPEFPRYQLRMPEAGTVKSLLSATDVFEANKPLVEITRAPELYAAEENAAQRRVDELELLNPKMNERFQRGLISPEEKQTHDTELTMAREQVARVRHAITSRLSFPFPGKVLQVWERRRAEGETYLEVVDSSVLVVTLSKPQVFLHPGEPVDLIRLIQRGYSVTLTIGGRTIPQSIRIEGEALTFLVPSGTLQEGQVQKIHVSIQAPPSLNEPASSVRHRRYHDVVAPEDGIVNDFKFLKTETHLPTGSAHFLKIDTAEVDSLLRELRAKLDNLKAKMRRAQNILAVNRLESDIAYELLKNDVKHAEEDMAIAKRRKEHMENGIQAPWDAVVVGSPSLLAKGQRINKNDPLVTLGSRGEFEAVLLLDIMAAEQLNPGDTHSVVLEGTQDHFPAVVRSINSAGQKMAVQFDIKDNKGLLREGLCVQYAAPSSSRLSAPVSGHWMIEKIRHSTDYDWVRNTLDSVARDTSFSQEERARIFNGIVQDPIVRALYKEWALIKLVDLGKIEDLFYLVQNNQSAGLSYSPQVEERQLFSFAFRLLHDHLFEVSLYNLPALSKEEARIDRYLASLMRRDAEKYRPTVELQMLRSQNSQRVLSRWLQIPELYPVAVNEVLRRDGSTFLERAKTEPLINQDIPLFKALSTLGVNNDIRRDTLAIDDYLTHGNKGLTETLTTIVPGFSKAIHIPGPPINEARTGHNFEPLEISNTAGYFTSPGYAANLRQALKQMDSRAAQTLIFELAGKNDVALSRLAQDRIQKRDLVGLIHLFNHLPPARQKGLISEMASSGLLSNIALYRETVAWDTPVDTVWAEFFRDFYRAALTHVTDSLIQNSLSHVLIQTYQTEIELARSAYIGNERGADSRMAKYYLRNRIAYHLLMERVEGLNQKANRTLLRTKKQAIHVDRAEVVSAARVVLEWTYPGSAQKDAPQLQEVLSKAGLSLGDVEERMSHYEKNMARSEASFWAAPQPLNKRTLGIVAVLSLIVGFVIRKTKTSSLDMGDATLKATSDSSTKPSEPILRLFAQNGNASVRSWYHDYRVNKAFFSALIGVRMINSILFIGFISFWELSGNGSEFFGLYLVFIAIDQMMNIFIIQKREVFGKLLHDLFPAMFKIEVERMRHTRAPNESTAAVFDDPFRTAKIYASGHLLSLYRMEGLLNILAIALGFLFIDYGLAIGYFGFAALFWSLTTRISSRTSSIKTLGKEKEGLLTQWMQKTVFLVQMGFSQETTRAAYRSVSSAIDRLIAEKMKYTKGLRVLAVMFPAAGALLGFPLSMLAITRGLESFFFLPDWAKEMSEWEPAEKGIRHFFTHQSRPVVESSPAQVLIHRLELTNFSLFAHGQYLIRNVTLTFPVGLHLIWGENGVGKTTFLEYLVGRNREAKASGQAEFHGELPSGETFTVNVRDAPEYIHYFKPKDLPERKTVQAYLDTLETADQKDQFRFLIEATDAQGLSQGQQQRLKLAFILAGTKAPVIFLDDVLAGMDPRAKRLWISVLKEYARITHRLILMAEPNPVDNPDDLDGQFQLSNGHLGRLLKSEEKKRTTKPARVLQTSA